MHKINKHAIKNILCDYVVKTKQKKRMRYKQTHKQER